jgi:MFS family permease
LIGSRMTVVALGISLYTTTGQTMPLLLTAFFAELPGMLGGSLAGVLVDRWPRKRLLLLADAGQAVGSLLLLLSFTSGTFQLWQLYAVALLQGTFVTVQGPAERATVTLLVPSEHRERANAIQELAFPLASILAPVLSSLVYTFAGVSGVIAIDLGTFVLAVCVVALLPIPQPPATIEGGAGRGNFIAELRGGLRYFRQRPALLILVMYMTFMYFLLNGPLEVAIPYILAVTGNSTQLGIMLAIMSAGAFAGGLLVTMFGSIRPRINVILAGSILTGTMFLAYGVARSLPLLGLSLFLLMLPLPATGALFTSILQVKTPPDLQGRVFAVVGQLALLGSTVSFLLTGVLVDRVLQPAVGRPFWRWLAPLVGQSPGAGIGLLLVMTGLLIISSTALTWSQRAVRHLEADLPEYAASIS